MPPFDQNLARNAHQKCNAPASISRLYSIINPNVEKADNIAMLRRFLRICADIF